MLFDKWVLILRIDLIHSIHGCDVQTAQNKGFVMENNPTNYIGCTISPKIA